MFVNNLVARGLYERILGEYECRPQIVLRGIDVGFNIVGREAGRVEQKVEEGGRAHIYGIFYAPDSLREFPAFYEKDF